jgi:hypothetical protein
MNDACNEDIGIFIFSLPSFTLMISAHECMSQQLNFLPFTWKCNLLTLLKREILQVGSKSNMHQGSSGILANSPGMGYHQKAKVAAYCDKVDHEHGK